MKFYLVFAIVILGALTLSLFTGLGEPVCKKPEIWDMQKVLYGIGFLFTVAGCGWLLRKGFIEE